MSLTIHLISKDSKIGTLSISNNSNITKTNWEIELKLKNFEIIDMDNLNFIKDEDIYKITPKEWKINIEGNTEIVSDFTYTGSNNFDYDIININDFTTFIPQNKGIEISVYNNTDEPIIINPGESYVFKV
jgi:hypothetical protein